MLNRQIKMKQSVVTVLSATLAAPAMAGDLTRDDFSPLAVDVNFDVFPGGGAVPNGTLISDQYADVGVTFAGPTFPEANGDFQSSYGPLASPPNVLLVGTNIGTDVITVTFVQPGDSDTPAETTAVGADVIFRDTGRVATLEIFDAEGASLGQAVTPPDGGAADEVFIGLAAPGI